jgi:hypothetical protein
MGKNSPSLIYSAHHAMVEFSDVDIAVASEQSQAHKLSDNHMMRQTLELDPISLGKVHRRSMAFNGKIPYIVYIDGLNHNRVSVKKFNIHTNKWELVGDTNFSRNYCDYPDIAFNKGVPYIAYADGGDSAKIKVKKLNGDTWETVGDTDFSGHHSSYSYIACNNGDVYIAYCDGGNANKVTVRKYNISSKKWEQVGEALSSGYISNKLIFINNIPYLSYSDGNKDHRLTIEKFNGKVWESVGAMGDVD